MARFATQFTRKLHVAFATMLLITLALAWYFSDTVKWYQYDVERIALANICFARISGSVHPDVAGTQ